MFIDARISGERNPGIEKLAAQRAIDFLRQVSGERHKLNLPATVIDQEPESQVVREMWNSCRKIMSTDLTPMAAVAGSIADATADFLTAVGATTSIVNNGGDIALRLMDETRITIGIRSDIASPTVDYKLSVSRTDGVGGVCTSGLGGRSMTRGIASSAVIFASRCSTADAAATEIANHTCIKSPKISRTLARKLDPDSDIGDLDVTEGYEELSDEEIENALNNGLVRAKSLIENGLILGVFLKVCNSFVTCGDIMAGLERV